MSSPEELEKRLASNLRVSHRRAAGALLVRALVQSRAKRAPLRSSGSRREAAFLRRNGDVDRVRERPDRPPSLGSSRERERVKDSARGRSFAGTTVWYLLEDDSSSSAIAVLVLSLDFSRESERELKLSMLDSAFLPKVGDELAEDVDASEVLRE